MLLTTGEATFSYYDDIYHQA